MGKHKNSRQETIICEFAKNNPEIARGYTKKDKLIVEDLWKELAQKLNSEGPPQKDVSGWKKVFRIDWKATIKKKLAHNKREINATGGGPYNIVPLSPNELEIAEITGLNHIVEGISSSFTFGINSSKTSEVFNNINQSGESENECEKIQNENNCETISEKTSEKIVTSKPKTNVLRNQRNLEDYMKQQSTTMQNIVDVLKESVQNGKENSRCLKRTYQSLEKLCDCIKQQNAETLRHNMQMEKARLEFWKLKKKSSRFP